MTNTNNLPTTPEMLREWNSEKEVCSFLHVSRSFFNFHLRPMIKEHKWSSHLIRYHKDDVIRLSEQLRAGGLN